MCIIFNEQKNRFLLEMVNGNVSLGLTKKKKEMF